MDLDLIGLVGEYSLAIAALERTGILSLLPRSQILGVIGTDGQEYPVPTRSQVVELVAQNAELVNRKTSQGFDGLVLTPFAMPLSTLIQLLNTAIIDHASAGNIYRTRRSTADPLVPTRVNSEKQVWMWETLRQKMETDELVYFPLEYTHNHRGQTKQGVIHNRQICAVPGWSVGLVESLAMMPEPGQGSIVEGRKQLETGCSPNEYLHTLQSETYQGETGKTLEDFITEFLVHLETTHEVSYDVDDHNALWCLGQYMRMPYADLAPTGRWVRSVGRVRLDLHRANNKECTRAWGGATVVRLGLG